MNLEDYRIIRQCDCNSGEIYGIIFLNRKHTVKEFQDAIYEAKDKHYEDIQEYGDDWTWIEKEIADKFDYFIEDFEGYIEY